MSDYWQRYLLIFIAILVVSILIYYFIFSKKKKKIESSKYYQIYESLGFKENIKELELNGNRLDLFLENKKLIDKENLKNNGVNAIVVTSKKVTLVIGRDSKKTFDFIKQQIKK